MTQNAFISHQNWDIKTPFISYSDTKFVKELENVNKEEGLIVYNFKKEKRQRINIFKRIWIYFSRGRVKIERENLLEKREKSRIWKLIKIF